MHNRKFEGHGKSFPTNPHPMNTLSMGGRQGLYRGGICL